MRRALTYLVLLLAAGSARSQVVAVDGVAMTTGDLDRATAFYKDVLQFTAAPPVVSGTGASATRRARLALGDEAVELVEFATKGRPFPDGLRSNDRSFQHVAIVVSDMQKAYARLVEHRVTLITAAPQRLPDWNKNAAGIEALYFRDPDGHPLEVIRFPAGKGDPRWQKPGAALFLGIDHTAITVADTERSLAFYRDVLGMRVAGGSENYGPEQERLNVVEGAHLRITTLRAPSGFGVELLEYLAPKTGRPMPDDERENDVLRRETLVRVRGAEGAVSRSIAIRDPDGHVVRVTNESKGSKP